MGFVCMCSILVFLVLLKWKESKKFLKKLAHRFFSLFSFILHSLEESFRGIIGFTLLHFKMAVIPLALETKMVDVGKLISLENLLVRKITWSVLTTTSALLILSRAFGADHMTRITYIYYRLPKTHSLTFWLPKTALSSSSFRLPETDWPCHLVRHNSIRITWVRIHSETFFFPVLPFWLDLFQPRTQLQKFRQTPKETNNQHERRHVPPRIHCYISLHWYLVNIHFIVYRTLLIFNLFPLYSC